MRRQTRSTIWLTYQSALEVDIDLQAVEPLLAKPDYRELIRRWRARLLVGAPLLVLALGVSGFVVTAGFNNTFRRIGPFARFGVEPLRAYFTWGILAIVPSIIVMTLVAVAVLTVRAVLGLLELIAPIGRAARSLRRRVREAAQAAGLDKSPVMKGFDGQLFNNKTTRYATKGEWDASLAAGWDFRRRALR